MSKIASTNHYGFLDGIRGLAALTVIIYHLGNYFNIFAAFKGSYLAVDLFYLLSGFVLTKAYETRILTNKLTLNNFIMIRIKRLYPLYLISVFLGLSYILIKLVFTPNDAFAIKDILIAIPACMLLLPNIFPPLAMFQFSPSSWSLSYEFWFNIFWAIFLKFLTNKIMIAVICISGVALLLSVYLTGSYDVKFASFGFLLGIPRFTFSFLLGAFIYRKLPNIKFKKIYLIIPIIALTYFLIPKSMPLLQTLYVFILFPLLVITGSSIKLNKIFNAVSTYFGDISYGIYVLHSPLILWLLGIFKELNLCSDNYFPNWLGIVLLGLIILISTLIVYFVDIPFRKYLNFKNTK